MPEAITIETEVRCELCSTRVLLSKYRHGQFSVKIHTLFNCRCSSGSSDDNHPVKRMSCAATEYIRKRNNAKIILGTSNVPG